MHHYAVVEAELGPRPWVQFTPPVVGQWELIALIHQKASKTRSFRDVAVPGV
jgi:hypothetical protein